MIFVFGSNTEGRHGKGAALEARKNHGAIYGQAEGRQGNSYAIITKELRADYPKVTIEQVKEGVDRFLAYAQLHSNEYFILTPIGCGLAGFRDYEVGPLFEHAPHNILIPTRFKKFIP